jgi:hypothetical protein
MRQTPSSNLLTVKDSTAPEREALANTAQVAAYLKTTVPVLANMRWAGTGPPFIRFGGGRSIRYRWDDVDTWLEANKRTATND